MDGLKILSLGHWNLHDTVRRTDECSQEEWRELLKDYNARARGEAANMAAHNWDVLMYNGQLIVAGRKYPGGSSPAGGWILSKDQEKSVYATKAPQELIDQLYDDTERKF